MKSTLGKTRSQARKPGNCRATGVGFQLVFSVQVKDTAIRNGAFDSQDSQVSVLTGNVHFAPTQDAAARGFDLEEKLAIGAFAANDAAFELAVAHHGGDRVNRFRLGFESAAGQDDLAVGSFEVEINLAVLASKDFEFWFTHKTLLIFLAGNSQIGRAHV